MLTYCLKYRKNTDNRNSKVENKNGRLILLSKCYICGR